jgi:hypothetical protein
MVCNGTWREELPSIYFDGSVLFIAEHLETPKSSLAKQLALDLVISRLPTVPPSTLT